jgi:hypothetical protein
MVYITLENPWNLSIEINGGITFLLKGGPFGFCGDGKVG